MGCCSSKKPPNSYYNNVPSDQNKYTLKLLKCYPRYPEMEYNDNDEIKCKPYFSHSGTKKNRYKNLRFDDSCKCCCSPYRNEGLYSKRPYHDSEKICENCESMNTDYFDEYEERKCQTIMYKPTKKPIYHTKNEPKCPSAQLSTVSFETKSSDSFVSFKCKCFCNKTQKYPDQHDDCSEYSKLKQYIGVPKEIDKHCTDMDNQKQNCGGQKEIENQRIVKDNYNQYINKMEKSWDCCYSILCEIKKILSTIELGDKDCVERFKDFTPITYEQTNALSYKSDPQNNEIQRSNK